MRFLLLFLVIVSFDFAVKSQWVGPNERGKWWQQPCGGRYYNHIDCCEWNALCVNNRCCIIDDPHCDPFILYPWITRPPSLRTCSNRIPG
uniref:Cysteine rich secreted protein n=1 Tax=Panagrellus redivivus TaxID=6233 RepID=A0A7E4VPN5_PANRE